MRIRMRAEEGAIDETHGRILQRGDEVAYVIAFAANATMNEDITLLDSNQNSGGVHQAGLNGKQYEPLISKAKNSGQRARFLS